MARLLKISVLCWLGLLLFCSEPIQSLDLETLGTFDGGSITVSDLNEYLGLLPASDRKPTLDSEPSDWLDTHLIHLFLSKVLVNKDDLLYLQTDHAFQTQLSRSVERRLTREYLIRNRPALAFSQTEIDRMIRDEVAPKPRIGVFSIFLQAPEQATQADRAKIRDHLKGIRRDLVGGTPFEDLAQSNSQSATASRGGWTGFMDELNVSSDLRTLLKGLVPEKPSQVVESQEGAHLFMTRIMPGRVPANQRKALERDIRDRYYLDWLKQEVSDLLTRRQMAIPSWPLTEAAHQGVIFQLGNRSLTAKDVPRSPEQPQKEELQFFQKISEILFAQELAEKHPEKAAAFRQKSEEELSYRFLLKKALRASLDDVPEDDLMAFLVDERNRFVQDEQVELSVFSWSAAPPERKTALDQALSLIQALQLEPPSTPNAENLERIPLVDTRQLAKNRPGLYRRLPEPREEGRFSKPFFLGSRMVVIRIDRFIAGELPPLANIRNRVLSRFLQVRESQLTAQWIEHTKKVRSYRTNPVAITRYLDQTETTGSL